MRVLVKEPVEPEKPAAVFNEKCIYDKETVKSEEKTMENNNQEKENPDGGAGGGNRVYYLGNKSNGVLTIDAISLELVPLYRTSTCSFELLSLKSSSDSQFW